MICCPDSNITLQKIFLSFELQSLLDFGIEIWIPDFWNQRRKQTNLLIKQSDLFGLMTEGH